MGFWVVMLIMDLLIPVTMIVFGWKFLKKPPKEINPAFGYRTAMSMKNKDTWDYAHKVSGKIWLISGLVLLPLAVIAMIFFIGKTIGAIGTAGGIICLIEMIPLIFTQSPTEAALKKHFDKNGNRK